jgi:hypothetical protein
MLSTQLMLGLRPTFLVMGITPYIYRENPVVKHEVYARFYATSFILFLGRRNLLVLKNHNITFVYKSECTDSLLPFCYTLCKLTVEKKRNILRSLPKMREESYQRKHRSLTWSQI